MRKQSSPNSGTTQSGSLPSSLRERLSRWRRLPREKKLGYLRAVMEKLRELAKEDKVKAWVTFNLWLSSEAGAIAFPWMWKRKYREVMTNIAYYYLKILEIMMKKSANQQKKIK